MYVDRKIDTSNAAPFSSSPVAVHHASPSTAAGEDLMMFTRSGYYYVLGTDFSELTNSQSIPLYQLI